VRAAVVADPGTLEITDLPDPTPLDHQVVVRVDTCGICGTDLHVLDGDYGVVRYPVIPGHEFAGTVVAAGRAVRDLAVGTAVAVDPMDHCDACDRCRAGWTNMCLRGGGLGTTAPGALAEYVAVTAARCEPLPAGVGFATASLVEPLSCVLHGVDRLGPVLGEQALVLGAGPIGLMMAGLLARSGAEVDVVDRNPDRLPAATAFGAGRTARTAEELDAGGWGVLVDATGNPRAVADAVRFARRTARIALLGVSGPGAAFPFEPFDVVARELTIVGVNSVRHSFGRAARLLADGRLPVHLLHGSAYGLDRTADALAAARRGAGLKTRVEVSPG
jgi:threonine dehydrogenase-like Zn-dependent dehydrogenase